MNFFKEIQQSVNEKITVDRAGNPVGGGVQWQQRPNKEDFNAINGGATKPPAATPAPAQKQLEVGDIIGIRPRGSKMMPIKAKVLSMARGSFTVKIFSPKMIADRNGNDTMTISMLGSTDIQNPYKEPPARTPHPDLPVNMVRKDVEEGTRDPQWEEVSDPNDPLYGKRDHLGHKYPERSYRVAQARKLKQHWLSEEAQLGALLVEVFFATDNNVVMSLDQILDYIEAKIDDPDLTALEYMHDNGIKTENLITGIMKRMAVFGIKKLDIFNLIKSSKSGASNTKQFGQKLISNIKDSGVIDVHAKLVGEASKPDAYQRDEINATSGFGKNSQAYRADGGANDEDHEGDAWREKQEKSGTWYIRLNGKLIKDKAGKPYSFHGKAAANKAALTMQAKLFNQGKEFMLTTNPNDKPQGVAEGEEHSPVASAITRRILLQRSDLLSKYGPVLVTQAIDEVADFVGDVEEIGSSDVSGWIKQVEQMLANNPAEAFGENLKEDLQADDGDYYESADDFFGQFEAESFDNEETSPDGMEVRGYIDGINVMVWRYDDESMTSGYGYYDDSAMQEGVAEASLAQMRDYFNQPDGSTQITRAPGSVGKPNANVPQEIQILINKMYHSGKVTPEEFKVLQDFQRKTKINVGIKEATTGNAGYDSMLAVMKAADAGQDATFDLGGEPITLDYNEARFLAGRYKAFLKAGRQEEFLKYMENPMAFDRLMKQLRDLMDKQKNFKGSVQGERGIEEGSDRVDSLVTKGLKLMRGPTRDDAIAALKTQVGERDFNERRGFYNFYVRQLVDMYSQQGMAENMQSLPAVNENEYWCKVDSAAKPIPEGYKKLASGYITKVSK